jgi:AraC family transcriptional regulator
LDHGHEEQQQMFDQSSFSAVVVQLVEAACGALDGDSETETARIALLEGQLGAGLAMLRSTTKPRPDVPRGGLTTWQRRRIAAHIDAHLAETIHIDTLARLLGLSSAHFSREFKRSFGVTAHAYVMRRRIEVAQGLMLTTSDPLSAIAVSCDMSDQSHLRRSFRRVVGETPDSWRRSRRDALADRCNTSRTPQADSQRLIRTQA